MEQFCSDSVPDVTNNSGRNAAWVTCINIYTTESLMRQATVLQLMNNDVNLH